MEEVPAGTASVESVTEVVLIEDNPSNLKLLTRIIARRPGLSLHTAVTGREGLELVRSIKPDLVLLDVHLPDIGGNEVLQLMKQDPGTKAIPVVVVSADATREQTNRLTKSGADAYLTKPIKLETFWATVDDLLNRETTV